MRPQYLTPVKTLTLIACTLAMSAAPARAEETVPSPADFHGATADKEVYHVVYQINTDDDKHIKAALKNISNALEDPRLKGKLIVEIVAHGAGVQLFRKEQPYKEQLLALQEKHVILAQCENTLRERNVPKEDLLPFISYVPSGNGEIIIRQHQGWAIVHP